VRVGGEVNGGRTAGAGGWSVGAGGVVLTRGSVDLVRAVSCRGVLELVLNGCGFVAVNTVGEVNELVGVVDARDNENSNYGTVLKPPAAFGPPGLAALLATLRCLTSSGRNRNAAARFTPP